MTRYFAALLMFFAAWPILAADPNGYTAQYECRANGPYCNVDVAALGVRSCDQIITPSSTPTDSWAAINWSNSTICIQAGDHRARGRLTLGSSGTSGTRKVLRYYRANDSDDEPWNQGANQAILHSINLTGYDYWVVHRLTIDRNETSTGNHTVGIELGVWTPGGSAEANQNIINRVLVQRIDSAGVSTNSFSNRNTVQNSVVRNLVGHPQDTGIENQCIELNSNIEAYIVNNELYDCNKGVSAGDGSNAIGNKIENNDIYLSLNKRTDCNGNYSPDGECSGVLESGISLKSSGTSGNPTEIIHNRIWGCRFGDGQVSQGGDCPLISISANAQGGSSTYTAVRNNILFDAELGVWNYHGTGTAPANPHHISVIGNLIYDIRNHRPNNPQELAGALMYRDVDNSEFYLNTAINATYWFVTQGYGTNNDIRCNVAINSGGQEGDIGSGTQVDNNAFYATPMFSTNTQGVNIVKSDAADAANLEYCFNRKLRTGPEKFCIPNARSTTASPHYQACNNTLGTRTGIGIDDSRLF